MEKFKYKIINICGELNITTNMNILRWEMIYEYCGDQTIRVLELGENYKYDENNVMRYEECYSMVSGEVREYCYQFSDNVIIRGISSCVCNYVLSIIQKPPPLLNKYYGTHVCSVHPPGSIKNKFLKPFITDSKDIKS